MYTNHYSTVLFFLESTKKEDKEYVLDAKPAPLTLGKTINFLLICEFFLCPCRLDKGHNGVVMSILLSVFQIAKTVILIRRQYNTVCKKKLEKHTIYKVKCYDVNHRVKGNRKS